MASSRKTYQRKESSFLSRYGIWLIVLLGAGLWLPTLKVYFYEDDLDRLTGLAHHQLTGSVFSWLLQPHNDHFEPLVKAILWIDCFFFSADLAHLPLHFLLILTLGVVSVILYALVYEWFKNRAAAILSAVLFLYSTIYADAVFFLSGSNLYCLFFTVLALYSLHRPNRKWSMVGFVSALLAVFTMASSYLLVFWLILAAGLCLPIERKPSQFREWAHRLFPTVAGWALGMTILIAASSQKLAAPGHYQQFGNESVLQVFSVFQGVFLSGMASIWLATMISWPGISLLLAVFALSAGLYFFRELVPRPILFLLLFIAGNFFIVFSVRYPWGWSVITWPRYHLFGAWALAALYGGISAPLLRRYWARSYGLTAGVVLLAAAHAAWCLKELPEALPETGWVKELASEASSASQAYFQQFPSEGPLYLKDQAIRFDAYPQPKKLSELLVWMVPLEVAGKLNWGERTSSTWKAFLKANRDRYPLLAHLFLPTEVAESSIS